MRGVSLVDISQKWSKIGEKRNKSCIYQKNVVLLHREKCTIYKNMHLVECKLNNYSYDRRSIIAVHEGAIGLDIGRFQAVSVRSNGLEQTSPMLNRWTGCGLEYDG